jgi:hypothetical protein
MATPTTASRRPQPLLQPSLSTRAAKRSASLSTLQLNLLTVALVPLWMGVPFPRPQGVTLVYTFDRLRQRLLSTKGARTRHEAHLMSTLICLFHPALRGFRPAGNSWALFLWNHTGFRARGRQGYCKLLAVGDCERKRFHAYSPRPGSDDTKSNGYIWFCRVGEPEAVFPRRAWPRLTLDGFVAPAHKIARRTTSMRRHRPRTGPCESWVLSR